MAAPEFITDMEPDAEGVPKPATTVFLIGKECPFRCLMCDLWKNTVETPSPPGALIAQLQSILPQIQHRHTIKLYNASNFFDPQAVPRSERNELARLVKEFELVVVENHPKLMSSQVVEFASQLSGQLQVAMGLETADETILAWLNKQMTLRDYDRACGFLLENGISIRTFILLPAPGVKGDEVVAHTVASVRHALDCGSHVTSLIPLRAGNGIMDWLMDQNVVQLPTLNLVADTFAASIKLPRKKEQRVLLDLWNLAALAGEGVDPVSICNQLEQMNLKQA